MAAATSALSLASASLANVLASANFADYADGPPVGQNGWLQYQSSDTSPLLVQSGAVSWAGGSAVNN